MMNDVKRWEGQIVEGRFPLRQYLGGSERSAVFLTERGNGQKAAIKLIPLDRSTADPQLARWKQVAGLSHPHLLQIFDTGTCRIENADFLFVVMEYAEEDLAQILPQRALTPGEAQQMLGPVVDVLRYLHGRGWVHGHLRPSNILASGEQVKISSDSIGKAGERSSDAAQTSIYDPPEKATGSNSAAWDIWALGMTLTEALTRQLPQSNGKDRSELRLPEGLSSPFLDIARNCLWRDPRQRWAIPEIAAQLTPDAAPQETPATRHEAGAVVPAKEEKPPAEALPAKGPGGRWFWALAVAVVIVAGIYFVGHRSGGLAPISSTVESKTPQPEAPPQAPSTAPAVEKPRAAVARPETGAEILERFVPNIPKSARDTIQGRVKVRVRVNVDAAGNVVGSRFDVRGPSEYFARQSQQAAARWKFAPSPEEQRQWVLLFEFARGGTQVFPSRVAAKH